MESDPNLERGITQAGDAPDQLDRGMAGQRRMVIVGDRRAEYRRQAVTQLASPTMPPNCRTALRMAAKAGSRRDIAASGSRSGNEPRGIDHVGTKDCHKSLFAIGIHPLGDGGRRLAHQLSSAPITDWHANKAFPALKAAALSPAQHPG